MSRLGIIHDFEITSSRGEASLKLNLDAIYARLDALEAAQAQPASMHQPMLSEASDQDTPSHVPGPYYVIDEQSNCQCFIVRHWDSEVKPGDCGTFGSSYGAHITNLSYTNGGVPTREQAKANAERLMLCFNVCEGITNKQLSDIAELGGVGECISSCKEIAQRDKAELEEWATKLQAQRDRLLACLRRVDANFTLMSGHADTAMTLIKQEFPLLYSEPFPQTEDDVPATGEEAQHA